MKQEINKEQQKEELFYLVKMKMIWPQERIHTWWTQQNPNFSYMSPKEMVDEGLGQNLIEYIKQL